MPKTPFKVEWEAHEYEHKERSSEWFWAVGIISTAIAITSIILGNIIFAILVAVASFTLCLFASRPPSVLKVVVDQKGITKDKTLYPYSTLDSFWIDLEHPHKKIILRSQKLFMPLITVPLGENVDPDKLHESLIKELPEKFHDLPIVEKILEHLGF